MEIFKDDNLMLRLNVVHKLRNKLRHKQTAYASYLHHRVGVGLTKAEFDECIKMLEVSNCCTVTIGDKGGMLLTWKEPTPESVQA